ncbi:hypothetical protein [Plebeiibacterium sediminum]|uniref:Uncharacterized protein n=1 Tax=Plebeiibacterium sediminum TaxID=2992112 RepID=A0AAE3M8Z9_9BACT|nr:hypothetical protein [Plebeiobacterium sediminum]MCW3789364.1 hypothetical protein [Plebeiobacterium sediminum]
MSGRKEYFESYDGRKCDYWRRFTNNSIIVSIDIEKFQTKRSKSKKENLKFQNHILEILIKESKRCFRGKVAVEFLFKINQMNPPAIQSLLKHYIDLIQSPEEEIKTNRKYLLIKDDSQIKALSAHYHEIKISERQNLTMTIIPFRDFVLNLEFARDIECGKFKELTKSSYREGFNINEKKYNDWEYEDNSLFKGLVIDLNGRKLDFYEFCKDVRQEEFKKDLLHETSKISAGDILWLITPDQLFKSDKLSFSTNIIGRVGVLDGFFNMNFGSVPVSDGERKIFKDKIESEIIKWWADNGKRLLPKNPAISLSLFYEKPCAKTHDLDNLLRYVLPIFDRLINNERYFKTLPYVEIYEIQTISSNIDTGNLYLRINDYSSDNIFRRIQSLIRE